MNEALIAALRTAKNRDGIEEIFATFGIKDIKSKIDRLDEAMYADEVFYSSGDANDTPDLLLKKYDITLGMFEDGSWRIAELYNKLGLPESDI